MIESRGRYHGFRREYPPSGQQPVDDSWRVTATTHIEHREVNGARRASFANGHPLQGLAGHEAASDSSHDTQQTSSDDAAARREHVRTQRLAFFEPEEHADDKPESYDKASKEQPDGAPKRWL